MRFRGFDVGLRAWEVDELGEIMLHAEPELLFAGDRLDGAGDAEESGG